MQDSSIFGETVRTPDVRTLYDMKEVIADKEWFETAENFDCITCTGNLRGMKRNSGLLGSLG